MAVRNFRVLAPELTVHKQVGELRDPITQTVTGIVQGQGTIVFEDEVIPEGEISPLLIEAIDNEDHPSHDYATRQIEEVKDDPRLSLEARLGVPVAGYEEMEEDDIVAVMRHLPSSAIQRIKEYESERDDPREGIVSYNIGFGESPLQRQEGKVSSDREDTNDDKAAARLRTREVPEDDAVVPGEGITGTGEPAIPYGETADEEEGKGDMTGSKPKKVVRRGRRDRQPKPPEGKPQGGGGGGLDKQND